MSGLSTGEQAATCMDAVNEHLSASTGCTCCGQPTRHPTTTIGFVTRVYQGIKENASIFSHTNPWAIIAECMLGRGDRAFKFYRAMLPHRQNDIIEIRQAEPYSYCQFIIGRDHPQHGQARHPWLTGSAGWFYTAATQWILGVRLDLSGTGDRSLHSKTMARFSVQRKWRGATYDIAVRNPTACPKASISITINGEPVSGPIAPQNQARCQRVVVIMG